MPPRALLASLFLASAALANAREAIKEISTSPDGHFAVVRVFVEDSEDSPYFRIIEVKSKRAVGRIPKEGQAAASEDAKFLWTPNGRRLAYNFRAGGRYVSTSIYHWKKNAFVEARSPETGIGYAAIEQERQKQLRELELPKNTSQRRIWDTWRIREWPDNDTTILLVHSIRTVPLPKTNDTADLTVWFRYTLKFDDAGRWKVAKTHLLTEEEAGKEDDE